MIKIQGGHYPRGDSIGCDTGLYTAISMRVAPEQSGKVEYEREKLAGSDN